MALSAKTCAFVLLGLIALILLLVAVGANYLVSFALDLKSASGMAAEEMPQDKLELWAAIAKDARAVSVQGRDGLALSALLFLQEEGGQAKGAHRYVISVHGYKSGPASMARIAARYLEAGWNVLAIEQRAHGESAARYTGMGYFEKDDLLCWISFIEGIDGEAQILLHGVSMGAATVMLATGEELPSSVRAAVEDCGYSTLTEELSAQLKALFSLPRFPMIAASSLMCKIRAGYFFSAVDCVAAVARSKTPTLFIHGEADDFVPFYMLDELYAAAACEKERLSVPGAAHAESEEKASALYWGAVDAFIARHF